MYLLCNENVKNTFLFSPALNTNICFDYMDGIWTGFFAVLSFFVMSGHYKGVCHDPYLSFGVGA